MDLNVSSTASCPNDFIVVPVPVVDDDDDDAVDEPPAAQLVFKKHASPNGQPLPDGHSTLHLAFASFKSTPQYGFLFVDKQLSIPEKQY